MTQRKPYNNLKITEEDMLDIFSANIHYLRKLPRWNLSQKTLARILHIPTKSYRKYELGRKILSESIRMAFWILQNWKTYQKT